jgi:hypothetical protein
MTEVYSVIVKGLHLSIPPDRKLQNYDDDQLGTGICVSVQVVGVCYYERKKKRIGL